MPDRDGRSLLHRLHLGGQARGGVRGDHGDEPVQLGLRPRLRRAVRARVPPRRLRRSARNPQPEALRDGSARRHVPAGRRPGHDDPDGRHRRRGAGGPDGGAGPRGGRLHRPRLRADGHARRLHHLGHPRVSLPARGLPRGHRPDARPLPWHHRAPEHRHRPRRHARRAEGTPRRGPAHDRRVVGQGHGARARRRRAGRRRRHVPAADQRRRAARAARPGRGRRSRRRRHGRLPRGQAAARLRARPGALPPRPGRDPRPEGRARGRDRRGDRVPLQRPSRRRRRPNGHLALTCIRTELGEPGEDGRRRP